MSTPDAPATVLIVGAGFAGLGTALRLRQAGVEDIVILERGQETGGTWRDNTYPGAACDIPSLLYSYSFAPNPDWSHTYSGGREILAYIRRMVDDHDLARHVRFGTEVTALERDDEAGTWTATVNGGEPVVARVAVLAAGPLANAGLPDIPGIETYHGPKIHSARWDHSVDLTDKRVAVVGTGASAVQIVPELVGRARHVKVFQRTAAWVIPRFDRERSARSKALFRRLPALQELARRAWFYGHEAFAPGLVWPTPLTSVVEAVARAHLRRQVSDPWLRRQLTPDFRAGCKRLLVSNGYYRALASEQAKLVSWPITGICERGIRTADGIEHELDAIVFATGFDVAKTGTPFPVRGSGGHTLDQRWAGGAHAYRSVSTSGFPSLFLTFGPNSGPGHNSALVYMEAQLEHITRAVRLVLDRDLHAIEVRDDVERTHNERLQRRLSRTTWNSGCSSWYLTEDGHNATMYPGFATSYVRGTRRLDVADYTLTPRVPARIGAAASV